MDKDVESHLPSPKWIVKGRKIEMPSGYIVAFGGKHDKKIIVTEQGSDTHVTFAINHHEYDLHIKTFKGSKDEYRKIFKLHQDVVMDITRAIFKEKENQKLWECRERRSFITSKKYFIDFDSQSYPELKKMDTGILDIFPEELKKYSIKSKTIMRQNFRAASVHKSDGACIEIIFPTKDHNKVIVTKPNLIDLILDTLIGINRLREILSESLTGK